MEYRKLGKLDLSVSEVGLGGEYLENQSSETVKEVIDIAIDGGVNILDIFMSQPKVRSDIGAALKGRRDKMMIQGHICSIWEKDQYGRSRNLDKCKVAFEDLFERLGTDYIDFGMLHFIDSEQDYDSVFNTKIIDYVAGLKKEGRIRYLGFSSHNAKTAQKVVDTGLADMMMFSINAAYDLLPDYDDEFSSKDMFEKHSMIGLNKTRSALYESCLEKGIGITVMKSLAGGILLDSLVSPFGISMTPTQCISYALSRPAVSSVLVGAKNGEEMKQALKFADASDSEKDFSEILNLKTAKSMQGHCAYCNHCLPCPANLDIAQITKYLDLARAAGSASPTVMEHYRSLPHTADECIQCGACESRCPFSVNITGNMREAVEIFK